MPEIHKFWSYDPDLSYVIYLTLCEYMKAVACLYLVRNVFGYAAALWFLSQAVNEATLDNVWQEETWKEYAEWAAFVVLAVSAYLFHRFNR